eukprot:TRINITY_DN21119_c0_g1_i2.p1 TRINITY_DN21119_c0_g1~~TRINITY_DN21119_c0_g1_i2.p1  ORF type:complete len:419 (+),score=89.05 TRINITY_DN21119_c0_g1_i2:161-1258(+)
MRRSSSCPPLKPAGGLHGISTPVSLPTHFSELMEQKLPRLRVAIFNACEHWYSQHPGATSCQVALMQTPWFYSKAVARFLHVRPVRTGGTLLSMLSPVEAVLVQAKDIRSGILCRSSGRTGQGFDVLVIPGGSTQADLEALGSSGCEAVRKFVEKGGGYCGICAGAFLGLHLRLLDAEKRSRRPSVANETEGGRHSEDAAAKQDGNEEPAASQAAKKAERQAFMVQARFTKLGRRLLWSEGRPRRAEAEEEKDGSVCMRYHNGPLLQVSKASDAKALCRMSALPESEELAPANMNGSAAVVMQNYGGGCVLLVSPHPESTQDSSHLVPTPGKVRLRRVLQRAVLLAAAGTKGYSWIRDECHLPGQ